MQINLFWVHIDVLVQINSIYVRYYPQNNVFPFFQFLDWIYLIISRFISICLYNSMIGADEFCDICNRVVDFKVGPGFDGLTLHSFDKSKDLSNAEKLLETKEEFEEFRVKNIKLSYFTQMCNRPDCLFSKLQQQTKKNIDVDIGYAYPKQLY